MNWPILHLFLSCLFLYTHLTSMEFRVDKIKSNKASLFAFQQIKINKHFKRKDLAALTNALCAGNKRSVSKPQINQLNRLNLLHLLTPSGLHLSSLLLFAYPLLKFLKRRNRKIYWLVEFSLVALLYWGTSLYSAKRVALLRQILIFKQRIKIPLYPLFLVTMFCDYVLGNYHASALSYVYSGVFLGGILCCENRPKWQMPFMLFSCQILLSFFSTGTFYFLGSIIGLLVTPLFSLVFPIFFLFYWIAPFHGWLEAMISYCWSGCEFLSQLALKSGGVSIPFLILYILPLFFLPIKKSPRMILRPLCATFLILCTPTSLYNLPLKRIELTEGGKISIEKITQIKKTKSGFIWTDRYRRRCSVKLYLDGYRELCD